MSALVPARPKIYHILHVDRLASVVQSGGLLSDSQMTDRPNAGTTIGMPHIKARRLRKALSSHPDLHVGDCVPFYFCPRSVMLYVISRRTSQDLPYRGGQDPIVHLEADLHKTVAWADQNGHRWAFTASNAGSEHFVDYADLHDLKHVNWNAVEATYWPHVRDAKQAEFLLERSFPWRLVARLGCRSRTAQREVSRLLMAVEAQPPVEVRPDWYYPE